MTKDEALKLALEALGWTDEWRPQGLKEEAITAIKEALAQREQEPVAIYRAGQVKGEVYHVQFLKGMEADEVWLYAKPQDFKLLTDDEIVLISADCAATHQHTDTHFARAIEQALKERNT